ncbi:hypothetical protein [Phenylobacterium sp.]|uniref:hypothetical protein n=1 Tax=Phenylobacterium sp. TaxID=1871053 RepID=UPI0027174B7C|nr:hypothetical protein [Phenylobacterium sp.]MDO8800102.1 hypothetical protein [Phenylobacterium sp.]
MSLSERNRETLRAALYAVAEQAIYRTAHNGPAHLCGLIADGALALLDAARSEPQAVGGGERAKAGNAPPIYDFVGHDLECDGVGRDDKHCTCGAMRRLNEIERAWALLWTVQTSDRAIQNARRLLSEMIDQDGRRRGIEALKPHEMPTGPTAEMMAPDFDGQEVTTPADGALEASSTLGTGGPIPPSYDPTKSLGERLYAAEQLVWPSAVAWADLTTPLRSQYERAALNFTSRLSDAGER